MRRLIVAGLAAALLLTPAGCKRKRRAPAVAAAESPSEPATMLGTADPRSALQLTKGFYEIENGGWRWSAKEFSAVLKPPPTGPQKGARLVLKFTVAEASITKLGPITLTAKVGSTSCREQRYDKPGQFEFKCDISAADLKDPMVLVDFALDKTLPATANDSRELGLVVAMVGFEAK